jgi:predicted RNA-binding Zn ribbon-like protein
MEPAIQFEPMDARSSPNPAVRRGGRPGPWGYLFEVTGGALCLDLANTIDNRPVPETRRELLTTYKDLLDWGQQAGAISSEEAARLGRLARLNPRQARAALARARAVREAMFSLFSSIALGARTPASALRSINDILAKSLGRLRLEQHGPHFAWVWDMEREPLDRVIWPVARSAAELVSSEERLRVRECAADPCGWLFLDRSKNGSRRWCDMTVCGNRAKARRHRARVTAPPIGLRPRRPQRP